MKLYSLYKSLILEGVADNVIIEAIDEHYRVKINYAGVNGEATGERIIEVYAYGTSKSGNAVIRAFQTKGDSSGTGNMGYWKLFRVDRITSWDIVMKPNGRPDLYALGHNAAKFNPKGDKSMASGIDNPIHVADFNNYG